MSSDEEGRARAQVEAAGLGSVYSAFPDDVLIAIEQAASFNRSVMEQRVSPLFRDAVVKREWQR